MPSIEHADPGRPDPEKSGRDIRAVPPGDSRLESGDRLRSVEVTGRLYGPAEGPLVAVAGGISADRHVARWWSWAVRPGGPVDLNRVRVLAFDWAPDAEDGPVTITTRDQADRLAALLDALGEPTIDLLVGASYGGCVGLAFAERFPNRIGALLVISAAHRAHPAATAWRGVQRRLLAFARDCGREGEGIALARELAMTTYRSAEEFALRFETAPPERAGGSYPVCDYLIARGEAYAEAISAARWISLSDSLDRHVVRPEAIGCALTVVGFEGDRIVPVSDSRELASRAPDAKLVLAPSLYGHDAFLKERDLVSRLLADAVLPLTARNREIAA